MNLVITPTVQDNFIILQDSTPGYKNEDNDLLIYDGTFRYIDLMSVDILIYHTLENETEIKDVYFRKHSINDVKTTYIDLDQDGHFTVLHMELPTKEFINNACGIDKYRIIYTDGKFFYQRYLGYDDKLSIDDIITLSQATIKPANLEFSFSTFDYVSVYKLRNYYTSKVIDNLSKPSKKASQELVLLRSYLDVIDYLNEHHLEVEANRLIQKLNNCTNVYDKSIVNKSGCGC